MGGKTRDNCACGRQREDGSCFTINELRQIAAAVRRSRGIRVPGRTKAELLEGVLDAVGCGADGGDRCVSQLPDLPADLARRLREALVPMAPREWLSNPTAWLSNFDIEAKVRELVRNKRTYRFLGVFPMDAEHRTRGEACVSPAVCDYHPVEARARHPAFAAVFNTDYHGLPGSHWVALMGYVASKDPRYGLYYYDSTGRRPTGDIDRLITRISDELTEAGDDEPPYYFNDTRHQSSNTECGMFCISFIDAMVNTERTFKQLCGRMKDDAEMIRRRSVYFELPR